MLEQISKWSFYLGIACGLWCFGTVLVIAFFSGAHEEEPKKEEKDDPLHEVARRATLLAEHDDR